MVTDRQLQRDRQDKYRNPPVHARRGLKMESLMPPPKVIQVTVETPIETETEC